jgi:hypothetical protein
MPALAEVGEPVGGGLDLERCVDVGNVLLEHGGGGVRLEEGHEIEIKLDHTGLDVADDGVRYDVIEAPRLGRREGQERLEGGDKGVHVYSVTFCQCGMIV